MVVQKRRRCLGEKFLSSDEVLLISCRLELLNLDFNDIKDVPQVNK